MSTQPPNRNSENIRTYSTNALEGQTDNTFKDSNGALHSTNEKLTIANNGKITFRERIYHFTWAWFTLTMSTGGIALLLANTPHRFNGLTILGDIVFILDLCLFILLCSGISARFILYPKAFSASLQDATDSLFFPTFWISLLSIIANTQLYGVPRCGQWLITTLRVIFWIYTALTFFCAVGQYCYLFAAKQQTLRSMTPAWILPIFLWATAFWFFCISIVSVLAGAKDMSFHLVWYAFVFPNVGFTIVIINIGKAFKSEGVLWVGSGLTIILVIVWLLVFAAHMRAVVLKQVLWPGKDEDKGERNE